MQVTYVTTNILYYMHCYPCYNESYQTITSFTTICDDCYGPMLFIGAFSEIPDLHTVVWGIVRKDAICDLGEGLFSSNGIDMDLFPGCFVMRDMPPD